MQLFLLKWIEHKQFDEESRIIKEVFKGKNGLLKLIEHQTQLVLEGKDNKKISWVNKAHNIGNQTEDKILTAIKGESREKGFALKGWSKNHINFEVRNFIKDNNLALNSNQKQILCQLLKGVMGIIWDLDMGVPYQ